MDALKKVQSFLSGACLPAQIYFAIVVFNLVGGLLIKNKLKIEMHLAIFASALLIGLGITWVSNYFCSQGWEIIAWLIVIMPIAGLIGGLRRFYKM